jgi:phenolic acid decarboxylase
MSKSKIYLLLIPLFGLMSCSQEKEDSKLKIPEKLIGIEMQYIYDHGVEYAIKYEKVGVSYQYKNGKTPDKWIGPYEYNYLKTESGEHLLSWFEPSRTDYVTQLINFDKKILYGSAILGPKHNILFHKADIHRLEIPE